MNDRQRIQTSLSKPQRLRYIDVLRGFVIILMALDHTRDMFHDSGYAYDPLDASHTTIAVYLTRLITHVCAPTFVLLAGVSAWLQRGSGKSTGALSLFLFQRGLWLIFLEATVVSFSWDFSVPYLILFQVIWAIGVAMIVLSGLVWLPQPLVCGIGLAIILGHNLLDRVTAATGSRLGIPWSVLHVGGQWPAGNSPVLLMTYPVLAWIGVMALGYGIGPIFVSRWRHRFSLQRGLCCCSLSSFCAGTTATEIQTDGPRALRSRRVQCTSSSCRSILHR